MSLLNDIQTAVIDERSAIAPLLLKLRLLAARLESDVLETWVKHESEGYPAKSELPDYRLLPVNYSASFAGPFGSGVNNVSVPSHLIAQFAGEHWLTSKVRSSVAEVEDLLSERSETGTFRMTNSPNLILLLNGKVFPDYSCIDVQGHVGKSQMAGILNAVRSKMLDLTLKIQRELPKAADIDAGTKTEALTKIDSERVSHISNSVIYSINNSGAAASIQMNVTAGQGALFKQALVDAGIDESDATELTKIVAQEKPAGPDEPLGKQAQGWLAKNLPKAVNGAWKASTTVATRVITEAALKYYGLK